MTKKTLEQNIKVQLGLLEAKAGRDASISWCKAMVNSRHAPKKVKILLDSTTDPETTIRDLRRQKVETKFYHVRTKILPKQMKKVKVFLTQRVVKKIKKQKAESDKAELLNELEKEISCAKALDHIKLGSWAFYRHVLRDDFLQDKLKNAVGMSLESSESSDEYEKISSIKCFQDAVQSCRNDLVIFMKKLLHEEAEDSERSEPRKEYDSSVCSERYENERKKVKPALTADRSFFVASLNEESDADKETGDDAFENDDEDYEGRIAFTDDENECEDYEGYNLSEEKSEKLSRNRKKNRLGQLARRRLAEKMYGRQARHIQSGGMTVQQREALRHQKSQQRRDRQARIKKETTAKTDKTGRRPSTAASEKESKSIDRAVKIDPNLHPSWAAKLKQQQVEFQGKKIVFDD